MPLPTGFAFSQASLQDYADCPRRFQLRYVHGVRWPTARDASIVEWELGVQRGIDLHRLAHQHTVGIPAAVLAETSEAENVRGWWQAYLASPPRDLPVEVRRSEVRLTMPLGAYRLAARYDLLAIEPGKRAVIVDWKTTEKRSRRDWLESRMQTLIYRYVLVKAGMAMNGGEPVAPDQVELVYWFAAFPRQVERFPYDDDQHRRAGEHIRTTVAEIVATDLAEWPLTSEQYRCTYCGYRTLCDRREMAGGGEGEVEAEAEQDPFDVDMEQIAEIEF
jgi:CRISPR/Cas system-associated exonuclease Cas4 (RecB family)